MHNKLLSPAAFIMILLLGFAIIPAANLLAGAGDRLWWKDPAELYNADVLSRGVSRLLLPAGISIKGNEVVFGRNGWLFLGDGYEDTITTHRRRATQADRAFGREVGATMDAWQDYLRRHKVSLFKILVGPDKTSIYPGQAAGWMKAGKPSVFNSFLAGAGSQYVDVRPALLAAKTQSAVPLYYRTDTHWNALGAGVAFREFARRLAAEAPELSWPAADLYRQTGMSSQWGGDLSAFLYLSADMRDRKPRVALQDLDIPTRHTGFDGGEVLHEGPNADVLMSETPIVVHSDRALNRRKVIWLRDSFGTALSPFMSYTFSDVLQLHWEQGLAPGRLAELVERWQPDYVFITVVERDARNALFAAPPPQQPN